MIQNTRSGSIQSAPRQPPHRADARADDARHLRRVGRSDEAQAAAGDLPSGARPAAPAALRASSASAATQMHDDEFRQQFHDSLKEFAGLDSRRRGVARRWRGGSYYVARRDGRSRRCTTGSGAAEGDRRRRRRAVLPGDSAGGLRQPSSSGWATAGLATAEAPALAADHHREAVRHRPRERARAEPARAPALRRGAGLPHRSLPRQGNRPEPAGVPLRQRHVRAGLEPPLHRSRADHRRRDRRRRAARGVLRGRGRAARHGAEPPDAAARAGRDGAADRVHRPRACAIARWTRSSRSSRSSRTAAGHGRTSCARSTAPAGCTAARSPAYRDEEPASNPKSTTETFVALRLQLDSWRWAGVPFYLRTGKRLPKRTTEIAIQFRRPPLQIFKRVSPTSVAPNLLIVNVQPDEGISVRFEAKLPGTPHAARAGDDELPLRHARSAARCRRPTRRCCSTRCSAIRRCSRGTTSSRRRGR